MALRFVKMRELIFTKEIPMAELESNKRESTEVLKGNQILDNVEIRELRELHDKVHRT